MYVYYNLYQINFYIGMVYLFDMTKSTLYLCNLTKMVSSSLDVLNINIYTILKVYELPPDEIHVENTSSSLDVLL